MSFEELPGIIKYAGEIEELGGGSLETDLCLAEKAASCENCKWINKKSAHRNLTGLLTGEMFPNKTKTAFPINRSLHPQKMANIIVLYIKMFVISLLFLLCFR